MHFFFCTYVDCAILRKLCLGAQINVSLFFSFFVSLSIYLSVYVFIYPFSSFFVFFFRLSRLRTFMNCYSVLKQRLRESRRL